MGDYWKPVFCRLEAEGFECVLAGARQVKNLPGRPKRDPPDSRWLAACFERGAVTGCFVATPEFRESAAIKISSVITNLHGMTGRLVEALDGAEFFPREHAALLKAMLERIDRIDAGIARLSAVIEELLAPYEEQLQQAGSMPGWPARRQGQAQARRC